MKNKLTIVFSLFLAFILVYIPADAKKRSSSEPEIKYVFFMIGDGMGINTAYGAELYNRATGKGPERINFLHFPVRTMINTNSATSLVTDSAAGGSAMSTGYKTKDGAAGVDASMNPVPHIIELAKAKGYGTGVATSVGINHATPAAFVAHVPSRNMYTEIIDGYISSSLDFMAGSGIYESHGGPEVDELESRISRSGITIMRGPQLEGAENVDGRLLCMAEKGQNELEFAIDQTEEDTNLSDFVKAGMRYLDKHYGDKGFFFMIEAGKIDYAAHSNDTVGAIQEVNDFAAAIDIVLEFYNEHPEQTLIVVSSDHDTGGMILGSGHYRMNPERLAWQNESENALTHKFMNHFDGKTLSWDEVKAFLSDNLGLWSHVRVDEWFEKQLKEEVERVMKSGGSGVVKDLYSVNSKIIYDSVIYLAKRAGYCWAHGGHCGSPVGLFVLGPDAESFNSCSDNTDIPKKIAEIAGY